MKTNPRVALFVAAALFSSVGWADDSALTAREERSGEQSASSTGSSVGEREAATTSRGVPVNPAAASKPASSATSISRNETGTVIRSTVLEVSPNSSHIVLNSDTAPVRYRYTRSTDFMDEQGGVLSPDAVKSGTVATLHFTRTAEDLVLTKVIVTAVSRPMLGHNSHALTEVQFDR